MSPRFTARITAAGALSALLATSLLSCASSPESADSAQAHCDTPMTIGFSHPVGEAEVVKSLKTLLTDKAAAEGCIDVLFDSTTANNLETQRAAIETWLTQGIDAIVVSPVDPSALQDLMDRAQADDISWISYAMPWDGADGLAGFDSDTSGKMVGAAAAEWIAEHHPKGGVTAAVTTLTPLQASASGRWTFPISAITNAGVEVVSQQDCGDQACGLEITESLLRQHPDLRVFVGFNDDAALGAVTAFTNAGIPLEETFIAGQDGSRGALLAVRDGSLQMTAAIDSGHMADTILTAATHAITGEGETVLMADTRAATADEPELLAALLAQFESNE